jgi:hypothetical protein
MIVVATENTPILLPNDSHKNFIETEKIIPSGTTLDGDYFNVVGKRKGKEFTYRLFKDKDGILIYENKTKPMEINLNANGEADTRVITLPSVKNDNLTHSLISVTGGLIAFAIAKKMGKTNKTAFMIGGSTAILGYLVANYMNKNQEITYSKQ